ncbi:hypothetical protein TNCV_4026361 [Trichonephila clavipes]|nr:hypothetical protein TNCV_4026361 [Trichonephila clavipes]
MRVPPLEEHEEVFITPVIKPSVAPVLIARSTNASASPQPVIIPEAPIHHHLPALLPDPPPLHIQVTPEPPQSPGQLFLSRSPVVEFWSRPLRMTLR